MDALRLEEALTFVEQRFGMEWLKDNIDTLKESDPERTTSGRYINIGQTGISPLAGMWYRAREEMALYHLNGYLKPSVETLLLIRLVDEIRITEKVPGFHLLERSLKDISGYAKTAYGIHIAAGFLDLGYNVVFGEDIGKFYVSPQGLTVEVYNLPGQEAAPHLLPALEKVGNKNLVYYFDCRPVPGEEPEKALEDWGRVLGQNIPPGVCNIVCTTTLFGQNNRGSFLLEKSVLLGSKQSNLELYLPAAEGR
jgi:hypothetical protein